MLNLPQLIKLTPVEADTIFPCELDLSTTSQANVKMDLVKLVIEEMIKNCGYAPLKEFNITKYYDSHSEQIKVDEVNDEYVEIADVTVSFENGQQESFIFVCLM